MLIPWSRQEAHSVDEVKAIKGKMVALAVYARQVNDHAMEKWAMEIRFRAERGFGQLLRETGKGNERQTIGRPKKMSTHDDIILPPRKLKDLGISRDQSSDYQKMAAIPEDEFEKRLEYAKRDPRSASTEKMLKPVPQCSPDPLSTVHL